MEKSLYTQSSAYGVSTAKFIFLLIIIFFVLTRLNKTNNILVSSWKVFFPLIIFSVYFTLSYLWNDYSDNILRALSFIQLFILSFVTMKISQDNKGLNEFIKAAIPIGTILSFFLILNYFQTGALDLSGDIYRAKVSLLSQHEAAIFVYLAIIPLYVKIFIQDKYKLFSIALLIFNIFGLLVTVSLSTIISLLLLITIIAYMYGKLSKTLVVFGLIIFFLLIFFQSSLAPFYSLLSRVDKLLAIDFDLIPRIGIWKFAFESFLEKPLIGHGYNSFIYFSHGLVALHYGSVAVHSNYFSILAEGGIIGLCLFLFIIQRSFSVCYTIIKFAKKSERKELEVISISLLAIIIYLLLGGVWHDNITNKVLWVTFGLIETLWFSLNKTTRDKYPRLIE